MTFTTLMNNIFYKYLDDFVIIYINNMLVYLKAAEERAEHLAKVFQKLQLNKLYAKEDKACRELPKELAFLDSHPTL